MIFPDQVLLTVSGVQRSVQAVVTFLDSSQITNTLGGTNLLESRFRIYLSPYGDPIPARGVGLSWRQFPNLIVEGLVEPHYRKGRLHHYECVARG